MWRPRGERGLSSCRSRFITLVLVSPRWSGLRSQGAGSPMTNVPVSRQQAPPGLATPSAQQAPRECLRVSVSGTELLRAPGFQKGCSGFSASSSQRSLDLGEGENSNRARVNESQVAFWGWKRYWESPAPTLIYTHRPFPQDPTQPQS